MVKEGASCGGIEILHHWLRDCTIVADLNEKWKVEEKNQKGCQLFLKKYLREENKEFKMYCILLISTERVKYKYTVY